MFNGRGLIVAACAIQLLLLSSQAPAGSKNFVPDEIVSTSTLTGWRSVGEATWSARESAIIGKPGVGGRGGWLFLDRSYQDIAFSASFRCSTSCDAGLLLRAEKIPGGGTKGVYVSLGEQGPVAYEVLLDGEGKEIRREKLRTAGGQVRVAPAPVAERDNSGGASGRAPVPMPGGVPSPLPAPDLGLRAGEWNTIEILMDANIVRVLLNDGRPEGGAISNDFGGIGEIALHVGASEVRFKDIGYKDLQPKFLPREQVSSRFRMQRLDDFYYAWSAAVGDINRDGVMDVVAGPFYYLGPDFTVKREIRLSKTFSPSVEYSEDDMVNFVHDFTGDGWPDVLVASLGRQAILYVNPQDAPRRWDRHVVTNERVTSEIALLEDIDGDGDPELVFKGGNVISSAKPEAANPTGTWRVQPISEEGPWSAHGLGVGDINGDGRPDVVQANGWWEQPAPQSGKRLWNYHPQAFGRSGRSGPGGAEMAVYDVNGDGLNDIVTSLEAHGFGLAWYEQKKAPDGAISFQQHMIMDSYATRESNAGKVTFSQLHGATSADLDGDGIRDFIVGKRYWSHLDDFHDPDPYGPPVLYVYRTVRNPKAPGGAEFVPELIHNRSGAGSRVTAVDVDGDGTLDIVTSTDRGTFVFSNQWRQSVPPPSRATR